MTAYSVAHLDEIEEISDGRCPFRPVRHHFGITSFGMNAWTGRNVGDRIINEHDEDDDGNEELYFVVSGRAAFEVDGERVDAPTGTFVSVPPGAKRTAFAEDAPTTILAVGGTPGKAYETGGWELWAPLNPLYAEGRYEEVADRARELARANPQYPLLAYNLACCESLLGRTDDALEHLRDAIARSDQFRDYARGDSDLDALRNDPAFDELLRG